MTTPKKKHAVWTETLLVEIPIRSWRAIDVVRRETSGRKRTSIRLRSLDGTALDANTSRVDLPTEGMEQLVKKLSALFSTRVVPPEEARNWYGSPAKTGEPAEKR